MKSAIEHTTFKQLYRHMNTSCFESVAGLRAIDQYTGQGAEGAWLLGILKRKIVDHVRDRNRTHDMMQETNGVDDVSETLFDSKGRWRTDPRAFGSEPSASLHRQEFWQTFRTCLEKLPQRQADVFTLREMEGLSSKEVCKEFDISPSNLWVLLYRARLRLSQCMKSRWEQPEGPCSEAPEQQGRSLGSGPSKASATGFAGQREA